MSTDQIPVCQMSDNHMSVNQMSVNQISVNQMSVNLMSVNQLSVSQMLVDIAETLGRPNVFRQNGFDQKSETP